MRRIRYIGDIFSDDHYAGLSDRGRGASAIYRCDAVRPSLRSRIRRAAERVRRSAPDSLRVFYLVVKNGANREESIGELARGGNRKSAAANYHRHLRKLAMLFD